MKKTAIFLAGVLTVISFGKSVWAQSGPEGAYVIPDRNVIAGAWQESVMDLKQSAETLLEENDKLSLENEALYKKMSELQKAIEATKQESFRLKNEPSRLKQLIDIESASQKALQKQLTDLQKTAAPLDKEKTVLEKKLSALQDKGAPLEESLRNLTAQKTNLEVDWKLKEQSPVRQDIERLRAENETLGKLIEEARQSEDQVRQEMKNAMRESAAPQISEGIVKDTKALQKELAGLEKAHGLTLSDIRGLEQKNRELQKSQAEGVSRKLDEKTRLEEESNRLGAQILRMRQRVADPLSVTPEVERADLDKMISGLEAENHELEQRIFDLNEAVLLVKRENTMIEALLNVQNSMASGSSASRLREGLADSRTVAEAMGYAYATQGMYAEAIEQYEAALKEKGNKKDIYFNLGYVYFKMGNIDEAMRAYKNVLKIDPYDYEAKRNIAKLREEAANIRGNIRNTQD